MASNRQRIFNGNVQGVRRRVQGMRGAATGVIVSDDDLIQDWLTDRHIEDVEAIVPDMAGAARGKVVPAAKFGKATMKMPEGVFAQTISGNYVSDPDNVEDKDMWLVPDPETLRPVPWAADPAAAVFLDCFHSDGSPVAKSPRSRRKSNSTC
jgi:glutamine synthetase